MLTFSRQPWHIAGFAWQGLLHELAIWD